MLNVKRLSYIIADDDFHKFSSMISAHVNNALQLLQVDKRIVWSEQVATHLTNLPATLIAI